MAEKKKTNNDDVLLYTGGATVREISRADWVAAGIEDQETVRFDITNNHRVPFDQLTEQARQLLLLSAPSEFSVNQITV